MHLLMLETEIYLNKKVSRKIKKTLKNEEILYEIKKTKKMK